METRLQPQHEIMYSLKHERECFISNYNLIHHYIFLYSSAQSISELCCHWRLDYGGDRRHGCLRKLCQKEGGCMSFRCPAADSVYHECEL
ncbi:hypothetical protein AC249_AIPGENE18122 [Exaiptasia diaphana]|nr:hypothetical protein AC249_AIPGENE18122 [Exaiptasia diaphana]